MACEFHISPAELLESPPEVLDAMARIFSERMKEARKQERAGRLRKAAK